MKKFFILLFTIPLLSLTVENDREKLIGKWKGDDRGEVGYIIFDKKGYAYFEIDGQFFGGEEFVYDGKKGKMTYEINDEVNPMEIDLILTKLETGEELKLLCIAKFIDSDTMALVMNFENQRPANFNSEYSMVFNRTE